VESEPPYKAFTVSFDEIKRRPLIDVLICKATAADPATVEQSSMQNVRTLWDTGAGTSVVSEVMASVLGLASAGESKFGHAGGESIHQLHFINVLLPGNILIARLRVASMPIRGCDMLIGMDVISQGDFALTNYQGKTVISFRSPSTALIDFERTLDEPDHP
jgi:hypothetical protein